MTVDRRIERLAEIEKRRNERMKKHDWRIIEKRSVNDFEKSAKDKRIEKLVKEVGRMTSE